MTISSTTNRVRYAGTGAQTVFPYTFMIFEDADLQVILTDASGVDTVKTLTTHYTVSGAGSPSGGNVTMLTAPASGEYLTIRRILDILQETDYVENDPFPAATHEEALDRLTMIAQQLNETIGRAIKFKEGSASSDIDFPELAAGEYVKVNADGTGLETSALISLGSEAAAVATAIAQCVQLTGDQTVAGVKTFSSFPVTPSSMPITAYQAGNKQYSDRQSPKYENLNINNTTTATSFVITADRARLTDTSGNVLNATAVSETCDVTGTGANGREASLTITTGTTYFLFLIGKSDGTIDSFLDDSATPALPAGYTYWLLISVRVSIATNTFILSIQYNNKVVFNEYYTTLSGGTATSSTAVDLSTWVPALTYVYSVFAQMYGYTTSAAQATFYIAAKNGYIQVTGTSVGTGGGFYSTANTTAEVPLDHSNSTARIYYYTVGTGANMTINLYGYILKI